MEIITLLVLLIAPILLALAALLWGKDSRHGFSNPAKNTL
jgi:hypothetical protein